jgi:hypothetical protein
LGCHAKRTSRFSWRCCDRRSGPLVLPSISADPCEGAHSAGSLVASCETVCSGDDPPARRRVRRARVALQWPFWLCRIRSRNPQASSRGQRKT